MDSSMDITEAEPEPEKPAPEEDRSEGKTALIMLALRLPVFLAALDMTIIATALPTIAAHFKTSGAGYSWIGSAYLFAMAATVPSWGKISDIGRKTVILVSGPVTRTSASAVSGGKIYLICRILVWHIPCSTETLSLVSIIRHSLGGSSLHENLLILSCRGKRYMVAILNRSSFERSTRPAVTIRAGRACYIRLSPKY
jgi:MFS family permease